MSAPRRIVSLTTLPLAVLACGLASAPWLRSFPSSVIAVPLFGAAVLSVLVPVVVNGIGVRRLWLTALVDTALLVFYELFVTLRDPGGIVDVYRGVVHGPAQLLSFALPLVSPRTLLVAPVALCWLSGALLGECVARGWRTAVPYLGLLVTLGLSYAATTRAITSASAGRRADTLIAAALLVVMLLLRAVGAWIAQDSAATAAAADSRLPIRGLGVGAVVAVVTAALAAALVQAPAFSGPPTGAARTPPVNRAQLLTPLSFVARLRPASADARGRALFQVTTDRASSNYFGIASVDNYDGDGWTFHRTFRPSGGVLPADTDPRLRPGGQQVDQQYRIAAGPLRDAAWLPALYRAREVTGVGVDVDPVSGMVVPDGELRAGQMYSVRSASAATSFDALSSTAAPTDYSTANLAIPPNPTLTSALSTLVSALERETGTSSTPAVPFLQAVARDFRTRSALSANVPTSSTPASSTPASSTPHSSAATAPAQLGAPSAQHAGGTSFADVLASIRQFRSATPEQFATLMCLVARQINVPARVVTGFRVPLPRGARELPAGTYRVTTAQAWSWVEIPIQGKGWIVLDASPGTHAVQRAQPSAGAAPTPAQTPIPSRSALITRGNNTNGHAVAPPSHLPHRHRHTTQAIVIIVAIIVGLLLLLALTFLFTRKWLRRRRRHDVRDPRRRLLGAWQECLDLLAEAGLADLTHATSREIVRATDERFGEQPAVHVRYLGSAANRAIFSPSRPVAGDEADSAWRVQHALRGAVRERLGWRSRLRSDLRYHRSRRGVRTRRGPVHVRGRH